VQPWPGSSPSVWACRALVAAVAAWTALTLAPGAEARTLTLLPQIAGSDEAFENTANTLQPGDTLVLRGGTYSQSARRAITCVGAAASPIVIMSYPGERALLTRPADNLDTQNNIEVVGCSYLKLLNLAFQGGSCGMRVIGGDHFTVEGCEIYETGNNGIAINSGSYSYDGFVIRGNEIHHTGISVNGTTEGEGMYLGCNDNACRVVNAVVEGNYIHHTRSTSQGGNDGIEVKFGSGGNLIRNNVIHDTTIGTQFPGIFVYGGGAAPNIVEGNAIWNAGEGIQVVSDATVRNNVVFQCVSTGITAAPHAQVPVMKNVTIVNNTLYNNPEGIYVRWTGASGMVLANNAIYSPSATAVNAGGLSGAGVRVASNYVEGSVAGANVDNATFFLGGTASTAFSDPNFPDFFPKLNSPLRGMASATYAPPRDFNETARTVPFDVGAYEMESDVTNPGWALKPGFKGIGAPPDTTPPAATRDLSAP
jgi:hypothetical protein